MPRYEESPRDRSPIDRRERSRVKSPSDGRRRLRDSPPLSMSSSRIAMSRDPYDDYPPKIKSEYKILCLSNITHKLTDSVLKEQVHREFSRFDVSVRICNDDGERLVYVYFRSYEEAREAFHFKSRMTLYDKPVDVQPIYETRKINSGSSSSSRRRSISPYSSSRMRAPSPSSSSRSRQIPSAQSSSVRVDKYIGSSSSHSRSNSSHIDLHPRNESHVRNDYHHTTGNTTSQRSQRESKKEKFPDFRHHIPPEDDARANRTLFVGNLESTITANDLKRIFDRYGVIEDVDVKKPNPSLGNPFAFIRFLNLDMAHRAKVEMSGQYIGKFQCKIGYGRATPTTRIWVGGLASNTQLANLEREFDRFGSIRTIDFVKGENHAYIQFDSIDAATAAIQEMRGHTLAGSEKRLRVDFADTSGQFNYGTTTTTTTTTSAAPTSSRVSTGNNDHYNSSSTRRDGNDQWSSGSTQRYHGGTDYGDQYGNDRNSLSRTRTLGGDQYGDGVSGNGDEKRGDYVGGSANNGGSGSAGVAFPSYWDEGSPDRRSKRPRTPDGDATDQRKRIHMSPDGVDDMGSSSPRSRPTRTSGGGVSGGSVSGGDLATSVKGSPAYDSSGASAASAIAKMSSDRNVTAYDNVATPMELTKYGLANSEVAFVLKNTAFPARMYHCYGERALVDLLIKETSIGDTPMLKITQRLRLDPLKLDDVSRRMLSAGPSGACVLLTTSSPSSTAANTPTSTGGTTGSSSNQQVGDDGREVQQRQLKNLVIYLKQKEAAGVISLSGVVNSNDGVGTKVSGVLYAFPPCPFAINLLKKIAPNLSTEVNIKDEYIVVVVIRGAN